MGRLHGTKRAVGRLGRRGRAGGLPGRLRRQTPPTSPPGLPDDVGLEVLNPDRPPALRCNPEIRLGRKVSARALESLSRRLLENEAEDCGFGLATYYLPAMRPGSGAWAIAELGPQVSVSILGLSAEDEAALLRRAEAQGQAFGVWVDDTSYASVMSLQRDGSGLKLTRFYLDGGTNTDPIRIASAAHGIRAAARGSVSRRPPLSTRLRRRPRDLGRHRVPLAPRARCDSTSTSPRSRARTTPSGRSALARPPPAAPSVAPRRRRSAGASSTTGSRSTKERWARRGIRCSPSAPRRMPTIGPRRARNWSKILDRVPPDLGPAPSPSIDTAPLLASFDDLRQACAGNREIKVLLDAASVTAAWRTLERDVEKVVSELRPVEE